MAYCTHEQYKAMGGSLEEACFAIWAERASRLIDRLTFGKAEQYAGKVPAELADACAQIADYLQRQREVQNKTAFGAVASANNDGYSESYSSSAATSESAEIYAYTVLRDALGADRYGLLYRGGIRLC